jgi:ATP-dependent Clp protease ATP-binding subunit ClpB
MTDDNKADIMSELRVKLLELIKETIRAEFLNRVDEIILFNPLTKSDIRKVVDIQIELLARRLEKNNIKLKIDDESKDWIGKLGYEIVYGARPIKRTIQKYLSNPLSEKILNADFLPGDTIKISLDKKGLIEFSKE